MNSVSKVSEYLIENANTIAVEVVEYNINKLEFEVPEAVRNYTIMFQTDFIKLLGKVITIEDNEKVASEFNKWHKKYELQNRPATGAKVSSIVAPYADVRLFFNKRLTIISKNHHLSIDEAAMIQSRLNYMLDLGLTKAIIDFETHTEEETKKRRAEILKLASPVVPIHNGIAVLPLIGSIDFERAEHLFSITVPRISELRVKTLIIDFSGIVNIDTEAANHIFNLYKVLNLLGIRVVFTGIRPDLASKSVSIGSSLTAIESYTNVEKALNHIGI
ncbi:anti-anti-sigma factor [Bacillus sp. M6-12]|uniref:STAS domain-containing protein n=1 Tax=Bacillus sp. M6-12 TaxID=2054166 RepID=UPI000C77441A|nr:STAS domain-containing protein [Bacillus sp. M6-12]PLS17486.1 anti-anti-sigma factor [Bacillus sp. M6-12]